MFAVSIIGHSIMTDPPSGARTRSPEFENPKMEGRRVSSPSYSGVVLEQPAVRCLAGAGVSGWIDEVP